MRNASVLFNNRALLGITPTISARLYSSSGTLEKTLTDADFIGVPKFKNETSSDNSFDVGATIISSFTFSLNNFDGRFDNYSFVGKQIDAYCGYDGISGAFELENGTGYIVGEAYSDPFEIEGGNTERVQMGHYYMVSHKTVGNIINCVAYDGLKLLDATIYNKTWNTITAVTAVNRILNAHGLTLKNSNFPGASTVIDTWPDGEITDRQALAYIAQLCGCFARVNSRGLVDIAWYDIDNPHTIDTVFDHNLYVNPISYTGVKVIYGDDAEYIYGRTGYLLTVKSPIASQSNVSAMASRIGANIVGVTFTPGAFSCLSHPCYEVGDFFTFVDKSGDTKHVLATSVVYSPTLKQTVRCGAEAEETETDLRPTELSVHTERLKASLEKEITTFDAAQQSLAHLISASMGLYRTEEIQENGAVIYSFHNLPELSQSQVIWRATENAFAVSTDGGRTWNAGVDANGNILAQVLTAIGVNADWIKVGRIQSPRGNDYWDLDSGVLNLTGYATFSSLSEAGQTTINGANITTGTISADRIAVGDFTNYSQLNENTYSYWGFSIASRPAGGIWYQMNTLARDRFISDYYTVNGGEYYRIKGNIRTTCTGATSSSGSDITYLGTAIGLYCYDGSGASVGIVYSGRTTASGTTKNIEALVQIPNNARKMRVFVQTNGYPPFSGYIRVQNITVTRAVNSVMIVDGSITADKIDANAITSEKIAANAIDGKTISGAVISGGEIYQTVNDPSHGAIWPDGSRFRTQASIVDGKVSAGQYTLNGVNILAEGTDTYGRSGIYVDGHLSTNGVLWVGQNADNRDFIGYFRGNINAWDIYLNSIGKYVSQLDNDGGGGSSYDDSAVWGAIDYICDELGISHYIH